MIRHQARSIILGLFIISLVIPTFINCLVHAQSDYPLPGDQSVNSDWIDLRGGQPVSWEDSTVRYASQWISVDLINWRDEVAGETKQFSASESPHIDPGTDFEFENRYEGPKTRFVRSKCAKVSEQYVATIPLEDGRVITLKEYTVAVDIATFTEETYLSYFSSTPQQIEYEKELCRLETWDIQLSEFSEDVKNPTYPDYTPYHQVESPTIKFKGYNLDENYFNQLASSELIGTLGVQITVNVEDWQSVFKNIMTDTGNYTYTHDIWSRVLDVECKNTKYGLLQDGRAYISPDRTCLIDNNAPHNLDKERGSSVQITEGDPEDSQGDAEKTLDKGALESGSGTSSQTVSVHGDYLEDESSYIFPSRKSGWVAQGPSVGELPQMWLGSGASVVYSGNLGYDPEVSTQEQVLYGVRYRLKPELGYSLYKHKWHYESSIWRSYVYNAGNLIPRAAKDWIEESNRFETRSKVIVDSWYLKNAYILSTFFITVQIGAFYDWTPSESMDDYNGGQLGDIGQGEGDSAFPIVYDGTEESTVERDLLSWVSQMFRWWSNPGDVPWAFSLAGLVVLFMWIYWGYKAYNISHPKKSNYSAEETNSGPMGQMAMGSPAMMLLSRMQHRRSGGHKSFFDAFTDSLGKKILTTIVIFIVLLILFCIIL